MVSSCNVTCGINVFSAGFHHFINLDSFIWIQFDKILCNFAIRGSACCKKGNSFQFFTIPLGYLLGGWMVDDVFEPLLAAASPGGMAAQLFGIGKGSGAAAFFMVLGFAGTAVCVWYWVKLRKYHWNENQQTKS